MRKERRRFYRYSESFKEHVIQEVSQGSSISEVCRRYDIKGGGTVQNYLSLLTDMYSRKIVGWHLSKSLSIEGSVFALKKALRSNPLIDKLIHHSDRGIQYCSKEYVKILEENKIGISMTEENHCYENALAERVNGILKDEYGLDRRFKDFSHAEKACNEAVMLYNTRRPHLALKYKTPQQVHLKTA